MVSVPLTPTTNMEANMLSAIDQGCSQGTLDDPGINALGIVSSNLPQTIPTASTSLPEATPEETMKIAPIKATIVRKHSKQLPRSLLRRRHSVDETRSTKTLPSITSSLPDDLVCKVLSFLDVGSLKRIRFCSRHLNVLASRNDAGWENICRQLWSRKVHVPASIISNASCMQAYHESIRDARQRQELTLEELCYDPDQQTGTIWSFRFKECAGVDWTSADPWHCGLPCRKMVLLKDGSVKFYVPSASSESSLPELVSPRFGNQGDDNNDNAGSNPQPSGRLVPPPLSMSWRLLTRPMDMPARPLGSYVRFSVGGREVPTYSVRRSPTGNWGFVMESCWGLYGSFELPPKQQVAERRRLRRTEMGAMWVEVQENGEETAALMDDASLLITNEIQWREAFLYNVGARVLPEGDGAADEFDRAFRGGRP